MANSTVRGNKTTKELKKGVSITKKSLFKVLCMVLIIALLAPNAFAATPTPEAPLADAATVERVKQEIAEGKITDVKDVFLVAYQHLGANLAEEGLTAYINEDGSLGMMQIINNGNSDTSLLTSSGASDEFELAVSTLAMIDNDGTFVTSAPYNPETDYTYETVEGTGISVVQTAYYNGRGDLLDYLSDCEVQLNYMVTSISGSGTTNTVISFVQRYMHMVHGAVDEQGSRMVTGVVNGPYSFTPSQRSWYPVYGHIGALVTRAELTISGVSGTVYVETMFSTFDVDGEV